MSAFIQSQMHTYTQKLSQHILKGGLNQEINLKTYQFTTFLSSFLILSQFMHYAFCEFLQYGYNVL